MAEFSSSRRLLPCTLLVLGTLISRGNSVVPPPDYANTKQAVHKAEGEYGLARGSNDITIRDSTGHNNLSPHKAQRLTSNDTSCLQNFRFNGNICPVSSIVSIHEIFPNECRQCARGTTAAISGMPEYFLACVENVIRLYPCAEKELSHCTSVATTTSNSALETIDKSDPKLLESATKTTMSCRIGESIQPQNQATGSSVGPKQSVSQQVDAEKKSTTGKNNDEGSRCSPENGVRPHNTDCNKFQICLHGKWIGKSCELGAYFNPTSKVCENSKNIVCHPVQTLANRTADVHQRTKRYTPGDQSNQVYGDIAQNWRNSKGYKIPPFGAKILWRRPHPEYCNKFIEFDGHRHFIKNCGPQTVYLPFIYACGWPQDLGKIYDPNDCSAYRYCYRNKYCSGRCPHGQSFDPFKQACRYGYKCLLAYPKKPLPPPTTQAPPPRPSPTYTPRLKTTSTQPTTTTTTTTTTTEPPPTTTVYYTTPSTTIFYETSPEVESTTTPPPTTFDYTDYEGIEDPSSRKRKSLSDFDYPDDQEITSVCKPGVRTTAHPRYCDRFIECDQTGIFVKKCGPGTVFLPHLKVCGWQKDYFEPVPNRCGAFYTCDRGYKVAQKCGYNYAFDFETRTCSQRYRCSDYYSGSD